MKDNINDMEQYSRRECCEITGIPETPDEDTNDLVIKVGALMDIELDEDDISVSHRLPTPSYASRVAMASSSRPNHTTIQPKIIVKFVRSETKELFYTNRKHLRGKTTADLGLGRYSDNGLFTRPRMGPSLGFVTNVFFFSVDLCYILWSVLLHHLICMRHCWRLVAPLELYCTSVSQYYLSFKLSGKVVFFTFFAICPFISSLLLHSFSNYIVALRDDR